MRDCTIKHLENLAGVNKETGKRLADAMRLAVIDLQDDSPYTVADWNTITYRGHDSIDGEVTHYLEVDVHCEHYIMPIIVEFEITEWGIGIMKDWYEAY